MRAGLSNDHGSEPPSAVRRNGFMRSWDDLPEAIAHGAVKRLQPEVMTVAVMGLVPIMWSTGTGTDVTKCIAAPMIGGIFTSFAMELACPRPSPAIYTIRKWGWEAKPELVRSGHAA